MLDFLRYSPKNAVRANGYLVTSTPPRLAGQCTVLCKPLHTASQSPCGVYELKVVSSAGGRDWYLPYREGEAASVLVPYNQPSGTFVFTESMNGCSLEVRKEQNGNRFYHDSDGKHLSPGQTKFRLNHDDYMDPHNRGIIRQNRFNNYGRYMPGSANYAHTIICIRQGAKWVLFNCTTAAIFGLDDQFNLINIESWHVKDYTRYELGSFPDN